MTQNTHKSLPLQSLHSCRGRRKFNKKLSKLCRVWSQCGLGGIWSGVGETPILFICFYFLAVPHGIFVHRPGMGGMEGWSLNPWITKEVPGKYLFQMEPLGTHPTEKLPERVSKDKSPGKTEVRGHFPAGRGRVVREGRWDRNCQEKQSHQLTSYGTGRRNSLLVRWLTISLSMQGICVQFLVREDPRALSVAH